MQNHAFLYFKMRKSTHDDTRETNELIWKRIFH